VIQQNLFRGANDIEANIVSDLTREMMNWGITIDFCLFWFILFTEGQMPNRAEWMKISAGNHQTYNEGGNYCVVNASTGSLFELSFLALVADEYIIDCGDDVNCEWWLERAFVISE
jgi:hypothetical protein